MAVRGQLQIFLWAQKLQKSEISQILLSPSPRYGDVQVICQGFTEIQNSGHG